MESQKDDDNSVEPTLIPKSVSTTILEEFFDILEKQDGTEEISSRLRKVVVEDGVFAEPAIRAAIFPEES